MTETNLIVANIDELWKHLEALARITIKLADAHRDLLVALRPNLKEEDETHGSH